MSSFTSSYIFFKTFLVLDNLSYTDSLEPSMLYCSFYFQNMSLFYVTGIIPFSDCGEIATSLVSGVVSFMVEGRVGSVKG